eukprot:411947_1
MNTMSYGNANVDKISGLSPIEANAYVKDVLYETKIVYNIKIYELDILYDGLHSKIPKINNEIILYSKDNKNKLCDYILNVLIVSSINVLSIMNNINIILGNELRKIRFRIGL